MASEPGLRATDMRMDAQSLYREEIYTDRAAGTIRVLTPVTRDGGPDHSRPTIYTGEAQILTNVGPLPISFDIAAATLSEAVQKYGDAAKEGVERAMRELQEMRRQASSSILVPGAGAGLGGGLPPAPGGKIKLP
ncbi:MAG TPA: hypothetical protein VJQ49_00755 [Casimicrobiaceae bacterium]|nr:hypothetical protein [Casimicrobiaceae bacterium]